MALLTLLTAAAGATAVVFGAMLLVAVVTDDDVSTATTTATLDHDWWSYASSIVLTVAGIITPVHGHRQAARIAARLMDRIRRPFHAPRRTGPRATTMGWRVAGCGRHRNRAFPSGAGAPRRSHTTCGSRRAAAGVQRVRAATSTSPRLDGRGAQ